MTMNTISLPGFTASAHLYSRRAEENFWSGRKKLSLAVRWLC